MDTNTVPALRVLQPITTFLPNFLNETDADLRKKDRDQWWNDFEKMTKALRQAAEAQFANNPTQLLPYQFSVTENEIRTGLLALPPATRKDMCLWFRRNITDLDKHIAAGDKRVGAFTDLVWGTTTVEPDAKRLLDALRSSEVPAALPKENVREYDVQFAPGVGIDPQEPKHAAYLEQLVTDFQKVLVSSISDNLAKQPLHSALEIELVQHLQHACTVAKLFNGRAKELEAVRGYLRNADCCAPFVIYGEGGAGKTCLMSAVVDMARQELAAGRISGCAGGAQGAVVVRFIGLTSAASEVNA